MRSAEDILNEMHQLVHEMADLIRGLEPMEQPPILTAEEIAAHRAEKHGIYPEGWAIGPSQRRTFHCKRCQSQGRAAEHQPLLFIRPYDGALMAECPACAANTLLDAPGEYAGLAAEQELKPV